MIRHLFWAIAWGAVAYLLTFVGAEGIAGTDAVSRVIRLSLVGMGIFAAIPCAISLGIFISETLDEPAHRNPDRRDRG